MALSIPSPHESRMSTLHSLIWSLAFQGHALLVAALPQNHQSPVQLAQSHAACRLHQHCKEALNILSTQPAQGRYSAGLRRSHTSQMHQPQHCSCDWSGVSLIMSSQEGCHAYHACLADNLQSTGNKLMKDHLRLAE